MNILDGGPCTAETASLAMQKLQALHNRDGGPGSALTAVFKQRIQKTSQSGHCEVWQWRRRASTVLPFAAGPQKNPRGKHWRLTRACRSEAAACNSERDRDVRSGSTRTPIAGFNDKGYLLHPFSCNRQKRTKGSISPRDACNQNFSGHFPSQTGISITVYYFSSTTLAFPLTQQDRQIENVITVVQIFCNVMVLWWRGVRQ